MMSITFLNVIQKAKDELLDVVAVVSAERDPELLRAVGGSPTSPPCIRVPIPPAAMYSYQYIFLHSGGRKASTFLLFRHFHKSEFANFSYQILRIF